ncbi:hypothetical protein ACA910_006800 [Epithemia clementina (nom. ined.)]
MSQKSQAHPHHDHLRRQVQQQEQPQRELIISYQFRETNSVLKLKSDIINAKNIRSAASYSLSGVSRRVSSILESATLSAIFSIRALNAVGGELVISRARLTRADFVAIVKFLNSSEQQQQQQRRRDPIHSLIFKSCLLERMDAIAPLLQYLKKDTCLVQSICFTGVEVLVEPECRENDNVQQQQRMTTVSATIPTAYSCMVRPFLQQFPFLPSSSSSSKGRATPSESNNIALHKLTLQNVNLCGEDDGRLLAQFLAKSPTTHSLEMYQSVLGPQGSLQLCQAMTQDQWNAETTPSTTSASSPAFSSSLLNSPQPEHPHNIINTGNTRGGMINELVLRYCNLDDITVVSELVRQVANPASTITKLELHRNRSAASVILPLLSQALQHSRSLQHLILSDSPSLLLLDHDSRANVHHHHNTILVDDATQSVYSGFLQALGANKSLVSLQIDRCGLQSPFMGPLIQALESKADTMALLHLSCTSLGEAGLRILAQTLPLLHKLQSLRILCSAGDNVGTMNRRVLQHDLTHEAMLRQTTLTDFVGSGWLDSYHERQMQDAIARNLLLQKARSLLSFMNVCSTKTNSDSSIDHYQNDMSANRHDPSLENRIALGLWPHVLAHLLQRQNDTLQIDEGEAQLLSSSCCGQPAALLILQSIHHYFTSPSR